MTLLSGVPLSKERFHDPQKGLLNPIGVSALQLHLQRLTEHIHLHHLDL